jgi:hypothetical protein
MMLAACAATAAGVAGALELAAGHFAAGAAWLVVSVLLLRWPRSIWAGAEPDALTPRTRRLALLAICGVAVFFRVYQLNQPGLWGDDAVNGLLAFDILDGNIHSPFQIVAHSHSSFHALSNYPIAAAFWLFGPDITTLRLPGIILSALCVPLLYGTMAPLFGAPVALLAALFAASSPPQLTHAKALVQIVTGQFFQLAGLCLLVRGIAGRRPWLIATSALPLAACVYTYHSARIAPLVALAYALAAWGASRRRHAPTPATDVAGWTRSTSLACAGALLVFAIALVPAVVGYINAPDALVKRVGETSIWPVVQQQHSLSPLWDALWRTLLIFHYQQGPEYYWFGIATDPAVNVVIAFLLVHGLVESAVRWREPRHQLLLSWFVVGLAPGVLSIGAPRIYRAFLAMPPLYVWAALPVARLLTAGAANWSSTVRRGLAVALVGAVPIIDFNYYFYRVYTDSQFRWFQGERIVEMARTLRTFGPGWTGYVLADNFDATHETLRFLSRAWGLQMRSVSSLVDVLPLPTAPEHGALFMMSPATVGAAPAIEYMYPGQQLIVRRDVVPRSSWFDAWWPAAPAGQPPVTAAFYPVDRAAAQHPRLEPPWGLDLEYDNHGVHTTRREPYPFYAFLRPTFSHPLDVRWHGRLTVPPPGNYRLELRAFARGTLLIDGRPTTATDVLSAGTHEFEIELRALPEPVLLELFWQAAGGPRTLIPPSAFSPPLRPPAGEVN